jgi:putative hydrolase of the HAD superfamily
MIGDYDRTMRLSGILFDLDGTLADTASAERDSWPALGAVIAEHAPTVDVAELHTRYATLFTGHWTAYLEGRIDFVEYRRRRLAEALEPWQALDDELFHAYREEKRRTLERLRAFPDAVPTIRSLRARGLRVGLLTNGPSALQRAKLDVTNLRPELDAVAISEEIGVAKPAGAAFETAASLIGCAIAEVAMVGDSPEYDIAGAIAAGLPAAVLVTHGLPLAADGSIAVESLAEVPAALGLAA